MQWRNRPTEEQIIYKLQATETMKPYKTQSYYNDS